MPTFTPVIRRATVVSLLAALYIASWFANRIFYIQPNVAVCLSHPGFTCATQYDNPFVWWAVPAFWVLIELSIVAAVVSLAAGLRMFRPRAHWRRHRD